MKDLARPTARLTGESAPSGGDGGGTAVCRCGAGSHAELEDRCAAGHVLRENRLAVVTGHRSVQFWRDHAQARREIVESVIADAGHGSDGSAPRALELAADGVAQAALVRDSAYHRMVEAGGPLTSSGRTRRAFEVWVRAMDRLERHLRMVGLRRQPRPVQSISEFVSEAAGAAREGTE
ncbi:MAG: hypothetical protein IH936_14550 [Acidobacteria bacterium]|nr:hypothetical protein [Acidobacteriota bacterium]